MNMRFAVDEIPEDGMSFAVECQKKDFAIDAEDCRLTRDVKVCGTLEKVAREVYCDGLVETELEVTCSRCLENFRAPVKSKMSAHFVPESSHAPEKPEVELHAGDIDVEYYEGDTVDLTQVVHDQILLTLPASSQCRQDCRGLCPHCGTNLNLGECGCREEESGDPRLDILKTLKDKIK